MSNQLYVKLNNGVEMPMAGIGTFLLGFLHKRIAGWVSVD